MNAKNKSQMMNSTMEQNTIMAKNYGHYWDEWSRMYFPVHCVWVWNCVRNNSRSGTSRDQCGWEKINQINPDWTSHNGSLDGLWEEPAIRIKIPINRQTKYFLMNLNACETEVGRKTFFPFCFWHLGWRNQLILQRGIKCAKKRPIRVTQRTGQISCNAVHN